MTSRADPGSGAVAVKLRRKGRGSGHVIAEDGLPGRDPLRLDGVRRLVRRRDPAAGGRPAGSRRLSGRARGDREGQPPVSRLGDTRPGVREREEPGDRGLLPRRAPRSVRAWGWPAGLSNSRLGPQAMRMLRGFIAGGLGGVSGGWIGAMIYQSFSAAGGEAPWWLRPVGWMAAGAMVGLADGLFTMSRDRMRNGVIGGVIGGLIGGALFDPIRVLVARVAGGADPTFQFEITSRAAGFVAVGFCIGAAVGLTHLLLKHAWLTVLDGDRPGRQVILSGERPDPRQRPRFRPPLHRRCRPGPVAHPSAHRARSRRPVLAPPRVGGRRRRGRRGEGRPPGGVFAGESPGERHHPGK